MNILVFGPPGSGKSTHSRKIVQKYKLEYISSGDLIRKEIERGSSLGKEMERYLAKGDLIPDVAVNTLVFSKLGRIRTNFILDGYPRTAEQVLALENFLYERGIRLEVAIDIFISKKESVERISGRRICSKCGAVYHIRYKPPKIDGKCDICGGEIIQRKDDRPELVGKRYDIYIKNMKPIITFYKKQGIYVQINGHGGIDEVWERIRPLLDYIHNKEMKRKEHE